MYLGLHRCYIIIYYRWTKFIFVPTFEENHILDAYFRLCHPEVIAKDLI